MSTANYYCSGEQCRQTTRRLTVRLQRRTYLYCVKCGRRLEKQDGCDESRKPRQG